MDGVRFICGEAAIRQTRSAIWLSRLLVPLPKQHRQQHRQQHRPTEPLVTVGPDYHMQNVQLTNVVRDLQ